MTVIWQIFVLFVNLVSSAFKKKEKKKESLSISIEKFERCRLTKYEWEMSF